MPSTWLARIRGNIIIQLASQEKLWWAHAGSYWWERNGMSYQFYFFATFKIHALKNLDVTGLVDEVRAMDTVLHRPQ